jgi:hypothetical protein
MNNLPFGGSSQLLLQATQITVSPIHIQLCSGISARANRLSGETRWPMYTELVIDARLTVYLSRVDWTVTLRTFKAVKTTEQTLKTCKNTEVKQFEYAMIIMQLSTLE